VPAYVLVDDVAAATKKAQSLGATVAKGQAQVDDVSDHRRRAPTASMVRVDARVDDRAGLIRPG
jgi:hypothetical protein